MLAAAAALLDSVAAVVAAVVAVLLAQAVVAVLLVLLPVLRQVAVVLAQVPPQPLLLHLLPFLLLPQVVVESEVPLHLSGPPVVLSRNGKEFTANGATNVRAGTEYKVTTERPNLNLSVSQLDAGSWVMFELPGFTTAAAGTAVDSLDALRKASTTSYYKGDGSLWVKLVSTGDILGSGPGRGPSGGASLQASR